MINPMTPKTESIIPKDLFSISGKKQTICRYNCSAMRKVNKDRSFLSSLTHPDGDQPFDHSLFF